MFCLLYIKVVLIAISLNIICSTGYMCKKYILLAAFIGIHRMNCYVI